MTKVSKRWTEQEFAGLDLGDGRLNKRAKILMERFAANPTASILMACESWAETCAAYRFLGNDAPIGGIKVSSTRDDVRY